MSSFEQAPKFPAQVKHSFLAEGVQTEVVSTGQKLLTPCLPLTASLTVVNIFAVYSDRIFVIITQIEKFGTIMKAWAEPKSEGGSIFQVSTLMGKRDDPLLHIYARQIIERLSTVSDKPLLLSISLKAECRDAATFQIILNELFQHNAWNE